MVKLQKYVKLSILFILASLLGGLFMWRMSPRTFEDIARLDRVNVNNMVGYVQYWEYVPKENTMDNVMHELRTDSEAHIQALWNMLSSADYRPSFQNLGPLKTSTGSDKEDGPFAYIMFMDGTNGKAMSVYYHKPEKISISYSDTGYETYYPMDKEVKEELVSYIMNYGVER